MLSDPVEKSHVAKEVEPSKGDGDSAELPLDTGPHCQGHGEVLNSEAGEDV